MKAKILLLVAVIFFLIALTDGRGGRGGGRGGRFSSRSRYGSSSRSRYVSKFSANRISSKSNLRTAILLGTVYGATRWRRRSSFKSKGDLPEVCYNDRYDREGNFTYYGRFLCPTDDSMGDDQKYCCGEEGQQYCCTFWDDGGRVAGVVIGILVLVIIVFVTCYCCIKRHKKSPGTVLRPPTKEHHQMDAKYQDQSVPLRPYYQGSQQDSSSPRASLFPEAEPREIGLLEGNWNLADSLNDPNFPNTNYPMGGAPYPVTQDGPPPSGAPPPYDATGPASGGLPYDPNPTGNLPYPINPAPFHYQPDQATEKPPLSSDGDLPYPINPTNPTAPPPSAPQYGEAPYPTGNPPYPPMGNMPYPPSNTPYSN